MKKGSKLLGLALGAIVFCSTLPNSCNAAENYERDSGRIATDVLIYRPAGLILTVGGSALFLLALPVTAISGGTKRTAHTLVETPFNFTFNRPIGTDLRKYSSDYLYR